MCEWEQECSDNPLLFDPLFARQYIKERKLWLINKQSMCAKCKLQLGEHLIDNQMANTSISIHQQCHDFTHNVNLPTSDATNFSDNFPFQELNSKELINKQQELRQTNNLIKNADEARAFNQNSICESEIKNEGDIFLINEVLREPLIHIANKLLGRQRLNFEQLTPKNKNCGLYLKTVTFTNSLQDKRIQCHNLKTFSLLARILQ